MKEISLSELNDLFVDTLKKCNTSIFDKPDEIVENEVLEDFDIGIRSFMHDNTLQKLYDNKYINDEILILSKELREKALAIPENEWSIEEIRNSSKWKKVMDLSDRILKLKAGSIG